MDRQVLEELWDDVGHPNHGVDSTDQSKRANPYCLRSTTDWQQDDELTNYLPSNRPLLDEMCKPGQIGGQEGSYFSPLYEPQAFPTRY